MTLREAVSRVLAYRLSHFARAQIVGYLTLISLYGWNVLDTIPKSSRNRVRAQLKGMGIEPDIDIPY